MKAINVAVLCGGPGTRMQSMQKGRAQQKCLIPVNGKPILEYALDAVADAFGDAEVFLVTAQGGADVSAHFGARYQELRIRYVHSPIVKGTKAALQDLRSAVADDFLMMHGDVVCSSQGLTHLYQAFSTNVSKAALLVAMAHHEVAPSHGIIAFQENRVRGFEFPPRHSLKEDGEGRYMGVDWFSREVLDDFDRFSDAETISGVLQRLIAAKQDLLAVPYGDRWYHFATPEDLETEIRFDQRMGPKN